MTGLTGNSFDGDDCENGAMVGDVRAGVATFEIVSSLFGLAGDVALRAAYDRLKASCEIGVISGCAVGAGCFTTTGLLSSTSKV